MKPYYEHAGITIYHGDCREILPQVSADTCITDPPYGVSYRGGTGGKSLYGVSRWKSGEEQIASPRGARKQETVHGDDTPFDPSPLFRFAHLALFGAQHYYHQLPASGTFHCWDKRGPYKQIHTADFDTIWIRRKEVGRIFRCFWRGLCRETEHDQPIEHPTQKPLIVVAWVLDMFPAANVILDPYAGSGTTLLAAKRLGKKGVGIEIEEKYCEIAAKRLSQDVLALEEAGI